MKAKIIEINGRYYMSVGGVIQYEKRHTKCTITMLEDFE